MAGTVYVRDDFTNRSAGLASSEAEHCIVESSHTGHLTYYYATGNRRYYQYENGPLLLESGADSEYVIVRPATESAEYTAVVQAGLMLRIGLMIPVKEPPRFFAGFYLGSTAKFQYTHNGMMADQGAHGIAAADSIYTEGGLKGVLCTARYGESDKWRPAITTQDERELRLCFYVRRIITINETEYAEVESWMQSEWTLQSTFGRPYSNQWIHLGTHVVPRPASPYKWTARVAIPGTAGARTPLWMTEFLFALDDGGDIFDPAVVSPRMRTPPFHPGGAYLINQALARRADGKIVHIVHWDNEGAAWGSYNSGVGVALCSADYDEWDHAEHKRTLGEGGTDYLWQHDSTDADNNIDVRSGGLAIADGDTLIALATSKVVTGGTTWYTTQVRKSTDGGDSWSIPAAIAGLANQTAQHLMHQAGLVLSNGTYLIPIHGGDVSGLTLLASTDGGSNWTVTETGLGLTEPILAEIPGDKLLCIGRDDNGFAEYAYCHSLTDFAAENWGTYSEADGAVHVYNDPDAGYVRADADTLGLCRVGGRLWMSTFDWLGRGKAYPTGSVWQGDTRLKRRTVVLRYSDDWGQTWSLYDDNPVWRLGEGGQGTRIQVIGDEMVVQWWTRGTVGFMRYPVSDMNGSNPASRSGSSWYW